MTATWGEVKVTRVSAGMLLSVLVLISLVSCEKAWHGSDGRPGDAYLALNWQIEEPTYIDAGTSAIPPRFYYGQYYRIYPGYYTLYYEGDVWTGQFWGTYAWEVTYEIWEIPGERGDWYYNGADGPDNYFSIVMSPYGPYIDNHYKNSNSESDSMILENSDETIVILQKGQSLQMKATFRKIEPRIDHEVK